MSRIIDDDDVDDQGNEASEVLPGYASIQDFTQKGLCSLMENIRTSGGLPSGQRWDYYTSFPSFKRVMDEEGRRILHLMHMILRHQGTQGSILHRDIEEKFELLVDANDRIFERVGNTLDEISGIRKNPEPVLVEAATTRAVSGSWNKDISKKVPDAPLQFQPQVRLLTAKNIERPQSKFHDKIDNSNNPWEPRIKDKPNALKPLSILLEESDDGECYSQPYEFELDRFTPSECMLEPSEPTQPKPLEETPLILVETPEQIPPLLKELRTCKIFAVDLEHHSYRTFQGFTCLMQISTLDKDYLIDTITLRSDLHVLNEVFTKPSILKVFHGAESDIEWLQRDLSLYVVNMFDTYQAAKVLNFAGLSLAFLMKHYCKVDSNKHFQLADWRIRPLPEDLKTYARMDTHYLPFIYGQMKNALLKAANGQTNLLLAVYQRSTETCKKRYVKSILREDSHMVLYRKSKKMFNNQQMFALQHLYRWRDRTAREEDESTGYVLPNHMLLHISELLPREMQGILSCCNPIPPLVRQHLVELHQIILRARDQPLVKPIVEEELRQRSVAETWAKMNLESPLHCPHDLTHQLDYRDDMPTLLNSGANDGVNNVQRQRSSVQELVAKRIALCDKEVFKSPLAVTVPSIKFDAPGSKTQVNEEDETEAAQVIKRISKITFLSPFERYKKVRPFTDSLERQKLEQHEREQEERERAVASSGSSDITDEERIQRMQNDIKKMANVKKTATDCSNLASSSSKQMDQSSRIELSIGAQAKGVKRKSEQLKDTPYNENDFGTGLTQKSKQPKTEFNASKEPRPQFKKDPKGKDKHSHQNRQASQRDFQAYDYQQADFSRFQNKNQPNRQDVQAQFKPGKQKKETRLKTTAAKATAGLEGNSNPRGRGRGRGRGRR